MVKRIALRVNAKARANGGGNYFAAPKKGRRFVHSGCHTLDLALGGGWAEGRIANVVGDKSTGKTLLCIEACANFLLKYPKGKVYYRETEAAFDKSYARALGMPVDRIDFGAELLETVEDMFDDLLAILQRAKGPILYICDSLDALSDRAEMERDMDKGSYGAEKAKKMSQLFRRLVRQVERKGAIVFIVSQIRDKIGAMFGRKVARTGGRAMDFYATHVLYLAHIGKVNQTVRGQKRAVAIKVKAMVDKNKVGLPFREAEFKIRFGFGIDDAEACVEFLKSTKTLKDYTKKAPDAFLDDLEEMDRSDYRAELSELHDYCTEVWYNIEKTLLPTRTKYGV